MSDQIAIAEAAVTAPAATNVSKKSKSTAVATPKEKKPKVPKTHPPVSDMVTSAVKNLKERGGSSLQAIKKYLAANYKVDCDKLAPFIKKFLKNAVANGQLLQTKGKGASGSFKLAAASKKEAGEKKKKTAAKPKAAKKPTVSKAKKATGSPTKIKKPVAKKLTEKKTGATLKKSSSVKKVEKKLKAAVAPAKKTVAPKKPIPAKKPTAAAKKPATVTKKPTAAKKAK